MDFQMTIECIRIMNEYDILHCINDSWRSEFSNTKERERKAKMNISFAVKQFFCVTEILEISRFRINHTWDSIL